MNVTFVGIKDFRQNIAEYARQAQKGKARYIVMNRTKPLFEIKAFAEDEYLDDVVATVTKAEAEVKKGKVHTHESLMKEFGLA